MDKYRKCSKMSMKPKQGDSKSGYFQPMTLDVDEKILDRNLKIINDETEEELNAIFPGMMSTQSPLTSTKSDALSLLPEPDYPSVQVTPEPGMCVKTKNIAGEKVFINLCKIQEIPPAPPLAEDKLQEIILNEDYTTSYKVPMSLGSPRQETDKSGQACLVSDVAINSVWYSDTLVKSLTFTTFVINLAMEGLCDKYGDQVNLDRQNWTILKNKKYMGTLQRHHIQQRPSLSKIQELKPDRRPVSSSKSLSRNKPLIEEIGQLSENLEIKRIEKRPEFNLFHDKRANTFEARIKVPGVRSGADLSLDVGEDRLALTSSEPSHYFLDIFIPLKVDGAKTRAHFVRDKNVLVVNVPVLS